MNIPTADLNVTNRVTVQAPARLHLGFLDLNGTLGRKFGSFGLAIDSHHIDLQISSADKFRVSITAENEQLSEKIKKLSKLFYNSIAKHIPETEQNVHIQLINTIPEHAGLGSGTQLALALGHGLAKFHQITVDTPSIAHHLGRGKRSGIGIATFDHGGFIVDGGLKPEQSVPPMIFQNAFPEAWRIVLVMAPESQGLHGASEVSAFKQLPEFPISQTQKICHLTLMQLMPALLEENIQDFGDAITQIQAFVGDHFAPAQGGRYSSKIVADCLEQAYSLGFNGIAQSSWGPTGCIFVENDHNADQLISQLSTWAQQSFDQSTQPKLLKTAAVNQRAVIGNTN